VPRGESVGAFLCYAANDDKRTFLVGAINLSAWPKRPGYFGSLGQSVPTIDKLQVRRRFADHYGPMAQFLLNSCLANYDPAQEIAVDTARLGRAPLQYMAEKLMVGADLEALAEDSAQADKRVLTVAAADLRDCDEFDQYFDRLMHD
jgi:hypothetical protein